MSTEERLQYRGKLAEAKRERARIEAIAMPYITKIRMTLDPTADRLTDLDLFDLPAQTTQLHDYWGQALELDKKIARLKEALGE
jgi:hypothetical protein